MTLEDLPILILEYIIDHLWYDELISLSRTNKYFQEKVSDKVIESCRFPQPSTEGLSRKQLRKPILRLEILSEVDIYSSSSVDGFVRRLQTQLKAVNLTRVGDLSLLINLKPSQEQEWTNTIGTFYHNLFIDVLLLMEKSRYKRLELQIDFLCQASRRFLETLDASNNFSLLEYLKVHIVNFHDGQTVGLYVHYIKMIFKISSLQYFEISRIPSNIFEELKLWFMPGNIYFGKIRPFSLFLKPKLPNQSRQRSEMLNKGFKFFGQGSSKKFQLTAQKVPWPFILSRLDAVKQAFFNQPLQIFRTQMETITRHKFKHIPWLQNFQTKFYAKIPSGRFQNIRYGYLAGAAILLEKKSSFDWEKERVSVSESRNYFGHIRECHEIQKKGPAEDCEWALFLEKQDITVWRREHSTMKGIYEYKMYGNFDDVSADEFLFNQLDMSEFRLSWDKNTAQAVVIDEDEESQAGGIVYYWEVNWPRFFSNRDYCCYRQTAEDPETGTVMVLSKSVDHPKCPNNKRTWRVKDYFSTLIVKPHTTSDKPGLEFCLTGYEDPGLQLPESIITWVAVRGMPEFMINLRAACLKLREQQAVTSQGKKEPEAAKESPRSFQENYQQSMSGQSRMYA